MHIQQITSFLSIYDIYARKKNLSQDDLVKLNADLEIQLNGLDHSNLEPEYLTNSLIKIYQNLTQKYMPKEKLSRKEKRFSCKPWLTSGIKTSMRTRDYLRTRKNKEKTEEAEKYYKRYKNFVNRLQDEAYNSYYSKKVSKNFKNKKKLWETVGEITKYKKRKNTTITSLKSNGQTINKTPGVVNCLNSHFNLIRQKMAKKSQNPN